MASKFAENRENFKRELCLNVMFPFSIFVCCLAAWCSKNVLWVNRNGGHKQSLGGARSETRGAETMGDVGDIVPQKFDYGLHLSSGWCLDLFLVFTRFQEKNSSIFGENLFLVFTEFTYLKKIVVEGFITPNVENRAKLQIIPPNAQQRSAPLVATILLLYSPWLLRVENVTFCPIF